MKKFNGDEELKLNDVVEGTITKADADEKFRGDVGTIKVIKVIEPNKIYEIEILNSKKFKSMIGDYITVKLEDDTKHKKVVQLKS